MQPSPNYFGHLSIVLRSLKRLQEGMTEMGFQPSDDTDIGSLFPKDVKLTAADFMTGVVFDNEPHELDDRSQISSSSSCSTTRKRTKDYFRRYIDDVYNGKIGMLTRVCVVRKQVTGRYEKYEILVIQILFICLTIATVTAQVAVRLLAATVVNFASPFAQWVG